MHIEVNGINLYYEKSGEGKPLIMLHGNGESGEIFSAVKDKLAEDFRVYLIDSRGHGKSEDVKTLDYYVMAEDIKEFIEKLNFQKPILYGFSDGGIIGLILAVKYQDMLSKLIISGANTSPKGINNLVRFLIKAAYFFTRSKNLRLMLKGPDIKAEELNSIKIPVLVLAGEKELVKLKNTEFIAKNIPNSTLKILKGETHGSYVIDSLKLYDIMNKFIKDGV